MRARVLVTLRPGVLDPGGQAVRGSLHQLGFSEVEDVRIGKIIEIELKDMTAEQAEAKLRDMGKQLLANTVVEDFAVELM